tara:strand:+ start:907 stop:1485 length:579 start_codon:yes stop_codon:yes gene_type:complete
MWQWVLGGVALAIVGACCERESARSSYEGRQHRIQEKTRDFQRQLQQQLQRNQAHLKFVESTNLHYQSHLHGVQVRQEIQQLHKQIDTNQTLREDLRGIIKQAFEQKHSSQSRDEKRAIQDNIEQLLEVKQQTQERIGQGYQMLKQLIEQLKDCDGKTRALKMRIRDECGIQGQQWYEKMEARTHQKRLSAH